MGSIRIGVQTQLSMLAQVLKNRTLAVEALIKNSAAKLPAKKDTLAKMLVLLNTAADLKAYR